MTLAVCWIEGKDIWCASDSRLTSGTSGTQIVSETASKIFIVPVLKRHYNKNELIGEYNYNAGFAYAGSSLLANNTHAIASSCTQIMWSDSSSLPSLKTIADVYSRVAEAVTREFNSRASHPPYNSFWFLIFGYCPVEKAFKAFRGDPQLTSSFCVTISDTSIQSGSIVAIGSGRQEFERLTDQERKHGRSYSVLDIFKKILDAGSV